MGIESVAVYSDADAEAPHVALADVALRIGPAAARESYLNIASLIDAVHRSGAQAVHPGYGFLSESAAFARAVEEAGATFVGPPPATQEALGNKLAARRAVADAGVPIVPGQIVPLDAGEVEQVSSNDSASADSATDESPRRDAGLDLAAVGYPAMLKAAAGGGGRGMRRVESTEDLARVIAAARREAAAAFGDGALYLERLISPARHVEVQLLGDRHGALAVLGERECSVQRRHQKLVEETPSPAVTPAIRDALFASARSVAATVEFHNAATVEFLLDADGNHYFLEMNTRLQVEHGVTELVTGLDIVAWQIRVAAGERLDDSVLRVEPRGHAIEARVYAEDPYRDFQPVAGTVTTWRPPEGPGIRVDSAVQAGRPLTPEYDPLLAKLMVHAADRPAALGRLRRALDECLVGGLQTDLGFYRWLVDDEAFAAGAYDTGLVSERWRGGPALEPGDLGLAALAAIGARTEAIDTSQVAVSSRRSLAGGSARRRTRAGDSAWARLARNEAIDR
jgi:acetyl-CoA/propionyl-CoA carboxylase, biotin carboxylase, biotin carboxyl carrier protein